MKAGRHLEGSKLGRRKSRAAKEQPRAVFIGTRPRKFPMILRGRRVEVEVLPVVSTTTHVNFEVTITRQGKALNWVPTRAERAQIGRAAGMYTEPERTH